MSDDDHNWLVMGGNDALYCYEKDTSCVIKSGADEFNNCPFCGGELDDRP